MAEQHANITELSSEQKLFIVEEKNLEPNLFGMIRVQVQAGNKWLVYRDGLLVKQLSPGPYTWWNGFLHKWKAHVINTRVELLSVDVKGRVKGPAVPKDASATQAVELACDVKAKLRLSVKIVEIESFIQYRDPLSVFLASIQNMVVELIGELPYDQYGQWAANLRDLIQERLQGRSRSGRDDAERRFGIRVEDVFVTDFQPNTVNDRNILNMYQLIERARRELVEANANAQRDSVIAQSFAEQGSIINIAPSILALQKSPVGKALIERDADLRGLMIHAGMYPNVNVTMQDSTNPSPQQQTSLYLHPPQPTPPSLPPGAAGSYQPQQVTGQIYTRTGNTGQIPQPTSSTLSTPEDGQPVDPGRQRAEITALEQAGYSMAGSGKVQPRYDECSQPIAGSEEWVLQAVRRYANNYLTVIFYCPAGYPVTPPRVQIKPPTGGLIGMEPNSIQNWHPGRTLSEVALEVEQSLPPA
jgi:hypothetical protein